MIRFLINGLLRDRHRSLFPIIIVTVGVWLTVFLQAWITGIMGDMIDNNAKFSTGHVRIMSRAYAENEDQIPNDLALMDVGNLIKKLRQEYPDMNWVKRIRFGGLLDVPDEKGETKSQGPTVGLAVDLLSEQSQEIITLNIAKALVRGRLPQNRGELLMSDEFATKLGVTPGETVTLLSSTMMGSMTMYNFKLVGTLQFGIRPMDRSAIIVDITDAQDALNMEDAAGEILGYFPDYTYHDKKAEAMATYFNTLYQDSTDEFFPVMLRLKEQNNLEEFLDYASHASGIMITVFVAVMSIVLWNAGLIGGLRRYGEVGLRLAIGESKGHIYRSLITESIVIGFMGSLIGTGLGLIFAYLLQTKGFDIGPMMKNSTMMIPTVFHATITQETFYIGFFPGLFSTVLGTVLSGIGIYQRQTAQLFRELET